MFFSRSFVASALLGLATATTHMGEMPAMAAGAAETAAASEAMAAMAGETMAASAAMAGETMASAAMAASPVEATNGPAASDGAAAAGMVNTHVVQVGGANGSLTFSPSNVMAEVGDLVQFQFNAKNHSVVQSTFDQPCVPIQNVMPNKTDAFFSGYMPTTRAPTDMTNVLTYTIRVTSKTPIWYYCSQGMHCQAGMVGAINAVATGEKTVDAFRQLAMAAPENITPGGASSSSSNSTVPAASPGSGSGASATSGAGGSAASPGADAAASGSGTAAPAEQSVAAAPGQLLEASKNSFLGLGLGGLAALLFL